MKLSNLIESFIKEMLEDNGMIELQRNELATHFNCVPSQINYVISTRFSPERGYIVESRRGGGGYIKITRAVPDTDNHIINLINRIGDSISFQSAHSILQSLYEYELITEREAKLLLSAISDNSIPVSQPHRDIIRSKMFKNILINLL